MNLQDLRYLVALADHRHFGRAAEACFVSQPTLSTQIKKLERELGVELIERTPRQIMLTAVGESIVERARVVLRETDNIREVARRATDPEAGSLRIGLFPTLAPYLLPHIVPELHERFPKLELLLVEEKSAVIHQRLRDGQLDIGLLALPVQDDHLHCEPLFTEEFVLAVTDRPPAVERAGHGEYLGARRRATCCCWRRATACATRRCSVCQLAGAEERSGFRATSLETLRQMVAAGVGVTLLPELAVTPPVPASPDIDLVRFDAPVPNRQIAMFWRRTSAYADFLPQVATSSERWRPLVVHEPDRATADRAPDIAPSIW